MALCANLNLSTVTKINYSHIRLHACFFYYNSVIGTPPQDIWPEESSISAHQFGLYQPIPWTQVIVEANNHAIDLISVSLWYIKFSI